MKWLAYAVVGSLAMGCGPVHKQIRPQATAVRTLEKVDVFFSSDGEFTVFEHRVGSSEAAAGALFGLMGAAIAQGIASEKDAKVTAAVAAQLPGNRSCRERFERAFLETLAASGKISARVVPERPARGSDGSDALLVLDIDHCGFRLMNQSSGEMAAFIEIGVKLQLADGSVGWEDRETVVATTRATSERLQTEAGLAAPQLEQVLADSGRQLANNLIYP